jgi:hypothetical protein
VKPVSTFFLSALALELELELELMVDRWGKSE